MLGMEARKNWSYSPGPCRVYLQVPQPVPMEVPPGHRRGKVELPGRLSPDPKLELVDLTKNRVSTLAGTDCPCACCLDKCCTCGSLPAGKKCPCWFCKREQAKKVIVNG